jgi:Arc/MetJ-type ribon-helix-helix transcriptional regulator
MDMQRISFTVPSYLHDRLNTKVGSGGVSRFISEAIEEKLSKSSFSTDPVEDFLSLAGKLPAQSREKIIAAIAEGRK